MLPSLFAVCFLVHISSIQSFWYNHTYIPGPIQIAGNNHIDTIFISDTLEISFDLQLNGRCSGDPTTTWCHILLIGDQNDFHTFFPIITLVGDSDFIRYAVQQDVLNINTNFDLFDGIYHHYYFKHSFTERIAIADNIVYYNITSSTHIIDSQYLNKYYALWVKDNFYSAADGIVKNLYIYSSRTTSQPTTNVPTTNIPTTNLPTTILPTTNIPTAFETTENKKKPTTNVPTTNIPTTILPTTILPTTILPTTNIPTEPLNIQKQKVFNLDNPITMSLLIFISILTIIIFVGYVQNKYPVKCSEKIKYFVASDQLRISRLISFVQRIIIFMNGINTFYGFVYMYFYSTSIYRDDVIFLIIAASILVIMIAQITINMIYLFGTLSKDLLDINVDCSAVKCVENNFAILALATIVSNSVFGGINLLNSNLFGMDKLSMSLSSTQIQKFKTINAKKMILLCNTKLIIHCFAMWYLNNLISNDHKYEYDTKTIKGCIIISILFGIFVLISNYASFKRKRIPKTDFVKTFILYIECDTEHQYDIQQIQRYKGLTKKMVIEIAKHMQYDSDQLEILCTMDIRNGILLRVMYNELVFYNYKNDNVYVELIHLSLNQLVVDELFAIQIKTIYYLQHIPFQISYEIHNEALNINNFMEWDSNNVLSWILSIENELFMQYEQKLRKEIMDGEVTGKDLNTLNIEDIKALGIVKFEHRKLLQNNIHKLTQLQINENQQNIEGCHHVHNHINEFEGANAITAYM